MFTQFKMWIYGAIAAVVAFVMLLLKGKADAAILDAERARRSAAEAAGAAAAVQLEQVKEATKAAEAARTEGAKNVEEAVTKAKSGDRNHFDSKW